MWFLKNLIRDGFDDSLPCVGDADKRIIPGDPKRRDPNSHHAPVGRSRGFSKPGPRKKRHPDSRMSGVLVRPETPDGGLRTATAIGRRLLRACWRPVATENLVRGDGVQQLLCLVKTLYLQIGV